MSTSPLPSEVQQAALPRHAALIHWVQVAAAVPVVHRLAPLCGVPCLRPPCNLTMLLTAHIPTWQPITQMPLLPCSCYHYSGNTTATQAAAETACQAMGGHLTTYESPDLQVCAPLLPRLA